MKYLLLSLLLCSMMSGCSFNRHSMHDSDFMEGYPPEAAIFFPVVFVGAVVVGCVAEEVDLHVRYGDINEKYDRWEADRRKLAELRIARQQSTSTQVADAEPLPTEWRELIADYEQGQLEPGDGTRVAGR